MLPVSRYSKLIQARNAFGEQLREHIPADSINAFAGPLDGWAKETQAKEVEYDAFVNPTVFGVFGRSGSGKSHCLTALAGSVVSPSDSSDVGTHVPTLIKLHAGQELHADQGFKPRASVILKSKDAIRAQAEDVCTRCDYASLDSMLGNEWDWEALDNAEGRGILLSTIEETWEGISQHLSDRLDATGTLQRDTNEELISALHDVMRPSRQASSQPQIWPFVKRVTVDMKLGKGRNPGSADTLSYGLESDQDSSLILAAFLDLPGKDGELIKQHSYSTAYTEVQDLMLVLDGERCNAPDILKLLVEPVVHKVVHRGEIGSVMVLLTKRDVVITSSNWMQFIAAHVAGSVTDERVVNLLSPYCHKCPSIENRAELAEKLKRLKELRADQPVLPHNKNTRSAFVEANKQEHQDNINEYREVLRDVIELCRLAYDDIKTKEVKSNIIKTLKQALRALAEGDQKVLLEQLEQQLQVFSIDSPAALEPSETPDKRWSDINSIQAPREHIRGVVTARRKEGYAVCFTDTCNSMARITDSISIQALSDHRKISGELTERVDVFREELIAAVSEIVDQENSSSKQRFADGFTVAMKQGVKAMTRAGREVLADIQKATADCPPDKAAVAAFRGVTQSGCYAGSISVSDRAPGRRRGAQVIHYDLAEEMRMAFSTALMSPSWKMRYHRLNELEAKLTHAVKHSSRIRRLLQDIFLAIFPDKPHARKTNVTQAVRVMMGAISTVIRRIKDTPEPSAVAHYEHSGRPMRAAAQSASRALAGRQVDQSLLAKQEELRCEKLEGVVRAAVKRTLAQTDMKDLGFQPLLKKLSEESMVQTSQEIAGAFKVLVEEFDDSVLVQPMKRAADEVVDACMSMLEALEVKKQVVPQELLQAMKGTLRDLKLQKPHLSGAAAADVEKAFCSMEEQLQLLGEYQQLLGDGQDFKAAQALLRLGAVVSASQAEGADDGDDEDAGVQQPLQQGHAAVPAA